ncbi:HNH endonuclease [Bacillus cereus group sp. MYBK79-1]|uniref:HNH endonuclease n=1 Tax=unclassified Bacillus cereus group TaxID=2750818 RepID=UPI003F7B138C
MGFKANRICVFCGQLAKSKERCVCQKYRAKPKSGYHPSTTRKFQRLRKQIILRDDGHCVRCRIKFGLFITDNLQCHHIQSWRDYPELAYEESNLITLCKHCNLELGNRNKLDFNYEVKKITPFIAL